ncbi:MAG TPA: MerR family transcriptional regulator [Candidatus Dormibacteraeota bacterium]|nr:MerR family transcriptional regulator [Candidatus Dormibacteraeota bacterium]
MRIAELARRTGVAPSAIRFYEAAGALPAANRAGNGYREYGEADVAHLRLVLTLRRMGVAPLEAGSLATLCLERGAIDLDLAPLIADQRSAITRQQAELRRLDDELDDLEHSIGAAGRAARKGASMPDAPIRVLFVCTGNSARSQLAEALLRQHGGDDFQVFSAGTTPKGVNPYTVRVLAEVGVDWSAARSKSVDEFLDQPFDYVVTVCDRARQTCPIFPGEHNTLHWGLDDPAEVEGTDAEKLAAFQRTRREIMARLDPFIELARRAKHAAVEPIATD